MRPRLSGLSWNLAEDGLVPRSAILTPKCGILRFKLLKELMLNVGKIEAHECHLAWLPTRARAHSSFA